MSLVRIGAADPYQCSYPPWEGRQAFLCKQGFLIFPFTDSESEDISGLPRLRLGLTFDSIFP